MSTSATYKIEELGGVWVSSKHYSISWSISISDYWVAEVWCWPIIGGLLYIHAEWNDRRCWVSEWQRSVCQRFVYTIFTSPVLLSCLLQSPSMWINIWRLWESWPGKPEPSGVTLEERWTSTWGNWRYNYSCHILHIVINNRSFCIYILMINNSLCSLVLKYVILCL